MGRLSGHQLGSRWEGLVRDLLAAGLDRPALCLARRLRVGRTSVRNGHRQWMASPLASPDGKWLAYQAHTWDGNVWMLESF